MSSEENWHQGSSLWPGAPRGSGQLWSGSWAGWSLPKEQGQNLYSNLKKKNDLHSGPMELAWISPNTAFPLVENLNFSNNDVT